MKNKTKEELLNDLTEVRKRVAELEKMIVRHEKTEQQLRETSIKDDLTGLLNRRGFFTLAQKQCEIAGRNNLNLSFLFIDLDGMKNINDEYGHKAGDMALVDVANILMNSFRSSDIISRIGGDEFVVIVTETPDTNVESLTSRLKVNLETYNRTSDKTCALSLSYGMTRFKHETPCSVDELMSTADKMMYQNKKSRKS